MNTTFKKTLVATAILAFAGAANAAIVKQVEPTATSAQGVAASVAAGTIHVVLKAEYAVGDTVTLRFPGAAFHSSNAPALVGLVAGVGTDTIANDLTNPAGTITATDATGLTFGVLSAAGDTVTFRVTALDQGTTPTTVNNVLALTGVVFTGASVTAAKNIGVVYSAQTSTGVTLDAAATNTGKLIAVKDQFELDVTTVADAVINVSDDRLTFTGGLLNDTIVFDLVNNGGYNGAVVPAAGAVTYTLSGDFAFMDADGNGTISVAERNAALVIAPAPATGPTIAANQQTLTFTGSVATPYTVTLTVPDDAGKAVSPITTNTFGLTSKVVYGASGESTYSESAGSWTLNGSQVRVPYMVLQNGRFSSILNVTNHGSKEGAISIDVFDEAGTKVASNYPAGTSKPGSVVSVATAARNALLDAGKDLSQVTKYSVQIVTNVPENDVIVYAAYADSQNGGERAIVNNDSKVQTKP